MQVILQKFSKKCFKLNLHYTQRCKENLCQFEKKPRECEDIEDCVEAGLCSSFVPCSCTNNYCALPWWVPEEDKLSRYCRNKQVSCWIIFLSCLTSFCRTALRQSLTAEKEIVTALTKKLQDIAQKKEEFVFEIFT